MSPSVPVPPAFTEHKDAIRYAAGAAAQAMKLNKNPYLESDRRVNISDLIERMIEMYLSGTPTAPKRPRKIDGFSALVGAATIAGVSITQASIDEHASLDWLLNPDTDNGDAPST